MSYNFRFRTYFSIQHIQSAALFAKLSKEIELEYTDKLSELTPEARNEMHTQHFAFVTNTIFSSVCFLEATINELFCDAFDREHNDRLAPLGKNTINLMKDLWEFGIPKTASYPILEKYQIALIESNKILFDISITPYQDINILIKLRNALMHYEPETVYSSSFEPSKQHKFEKMFKGKFEQNSFMKKSGNPYFPDKCLGYGCAEWAVYKSIEFVDAFNKKMDLKPMYNHVVERLYKETKKPKHNNESLENIDTSILSKEFITVAPVSVEAKLIPVDKLGNGIIEVNCGDTNEINNNDFKD